MGVSQSIERLPLFQSGNGGANPTLALQPKDLNLVIDTCGQARNLIRRRHYLKSVPADNTGPNFCIWVGGRLVGAMIWARPAARNLPQDWRELRRFYLDDDMPKNSESRCLSVSARIIMSRSQDVPLLISYSDPQRGHAGTIYRAAGWLYVGMNQGGGGLATGQRSLTTTNNLDAYGPKHIWIKPLHVEVQHAYVVRAKGAE